MHLTDLDGLKFYINKNLDGSCTEVRFETKLLLHFKQTAPSVGGGENVPKYINVKQLTDFLSDIRATSASRPMQRTESTSLLKYAVQNNQIQSQISLPHNSQHSLPQKVMPVNPGSNSVSSPSFSKEVTNHSFGNHYTNEPKR